MWDVEGIKRVGNLCNKNGKLVRRNSKFFRNSKVENNFSHLEREAETLEDPCSTNAGCPTSRMAFDAVFDNLNPPFRNL